MVLFIGGFPSGGTDLTKNILNAHPDIYISGEMPFLYHLHKDGYSGETILRTDEEVFKLKNLLLSLDKWKNLKNIDKELKAPASLTEALKTWFKEKEVRVWGNKTPQNSENIEGLLKIFPDAKFLFVIRDIRDIALSWRKKWGKDIFLCAHKWNVRMDKMLRYTEKLKKNQYIILHYEELITDIESHSKKICEFLNLNWSDTMLNYHQHVDSIVEGKINYGNKVVSNNYNKWEAGFSAKEIRRIEQISYLMMKHFSYKPKYAVSEKPLSLIEKLTGYTKDVLASLSIGNKFRKNNSFRKRLSDVSLQFKQQLLKLK